MALSERIFSQGEADLEDGLLWAMHYGFGSYNEQVAGKCAIGRIVPRAEILQGLRHTLGFNIYLLNHNVMFWNAICGDHRAGTGIAPPRSGAPRRHGGQW